MRPTDTHSLTRARQVIAALCISMTLSAGTFSVDSVLLDAYRKEDMSVWKEYVDSHSLLAYEYGYCGYIVAEAKKEGKENLLPAAKKYVQHFKSEVSKQKSQLPAGHYEMYLSAVYVYELRLHESIHPVKAMSLAKEAVKQAPDDPVVLSYYGTCLFYAPSPFGSKKEALMWFERAQKGFADEVYRFSWMRVANEMYINQCKDKLQP